MRVKQLPYFDFVPNILTCKQNAERCWKHGIENASSQQLLEVYHLCAHCLALGRLREIHRIAFTTAMICLEATPRHPSRWWTCWSAPYLLKHCQYVNVSSACTTLRACRAFNLVFSWFCEECSVKWRQWLLQQDTQIPHLGYRWGVLCEVVSMVGQSEREELLVEFVKRELMVPRLCCMPWHGISWHIET